MAAFMTASDDDADISGKREAPAPAMARNTTKSDEHRILLLLCLWRLLLLVLAMRKVNKPS